MNWILIAGIEPFQLFRSFPPCKTNISSHHPKFHGVKMVLSENTPPQQIQRFQTSFSPFFSVLFFLRYPWLSLFSDRPREVFPKQLRYRHVLGFNRPGRSGRHSIWDFWFLRAFDVWKMMEIGSDPEKLEDFGFFLWQAIVFLLTYGWNRHGHSTWHFRAHQPEVMPIQTGANLLGNMFWQTLLGMKYYTKHLGQHAETSVVSRIWS